MVIILKQIVKKQNRQELADLNENSFSDKTDNIISDKNWKEIKGTTL